MEYDIWGSWNIFALVPCIPFKILTLKRIGQFELQVSWKKDSWETCYTGEYVFNSMVSAIAYGYTTASWPHIFMKNIVICQAQMNEILLVSGRIILTIKGC